MIKTRGPFIRPRYVKSNSWWVWLSAVVSLGLCFLAMCRGCLVEEAVAVRALDTQGYQNIRIVDHVWFGIGLRGCSGHDAAKFVAEVTNPAGKKVQVFVCTGWLFKGSTIRTD
jgi:hypothetical protein